MSDFD